MERSTPVERPRCTHSTPIFRGSDILPLVVALVLLAFLGGCAPSSAATETELPGADSAHELVQTTLPVEVNARVDKWIRRFLGGQRPELESLLAREGLYGEMIREKLRQRGMPEDLIYLAMMESGFFPRATSSVEASGVWQFMDATARAYGLEVTEWVDERRDPVRATDAALDYLEELHDRFGSWYLAAAGYNAGPNRVAWILQTYANDQAGDEDLYWEIIDRLPLETREYVPRILAATILAREAHHFGLQVEQMEALRYDRVLVPGGTSLASLARSLDVPARRLRDMNPHLIRGVTPPGGSYLVRVPPGHVGTVLASLDRGRYLAD